MIMLSFFKKHHLENNSRRNINQWLTLNSSLDVLQISASFVIVDTENHPSQFEMLIPLPRIVFHFSLLLLETNKVDLPLCQNKLVPLIRNETPSNTKTLDLCLIRVVSTATFFLEDSEYELVNQETVFQTALVNCMQ